MKVRRIFTIASAASVIVLTANVCNNLQENLSPLQPQLVSAAPVAYHLPYLPDLRSNGNDYPAILADAPSHSFVDAYGMDNRSCSSYVLWKVDEAYNYIPDMETDNWPLAAKAQGIPTGSIPKVGSAAYAAPNAQFGTETAANGLTMTYTASDTGHVMWVDHVNTNGTITVSEYNLDGDGAYHIEVFKPGNLTYIYFGDKR